MATLNKIADDIIGSLDRPFDIQFRERVKYIFTNELAATLRQEINKRDVVDGMLQTYTASIIKVDNNDVVNANSGDVTYRTTKKVSNPVRYSTDDPFNSIKVINSNVYYMYIKDFTEYFYRTSFYLNTINTSNPVYYSYRGGYIYLHNIQFAEVAEGEDPITDLETTEKFILIKGVHNTFEFLDMVDNDANKYMQIYNDDTELPVSDDIIRMAKLKLLTGELSIIDDKDKVIPTHLDTN